MVTTNFIKIGFACSFLAACATPAGNKALIADGISPDEQMTVKIIKKKPAKIKEVNVGDALIKIDDKPVTKYSDIFAYGDNIWKAEQFTFLTEDGDEKIVQADKILDKEKKISYINYLADGEVLNVTSASKIPAAVFNAGDKTVVTVLKKFDSKPSILELDTAILGNGICTKCTLDKVAVTDEAQDSLLSLAPIEYAAFTIYPDKGQQSGMVDVPPPTLTGFYASSHTTGYVTGSQNGNYYNATYHGTTTTTVTPKYDYSGQAAAGLVNLIIAINNDMIVAQNKGREGFISSANSSTIHTGKITSGEKDVGVMYFAVPADSVGPYLVEYTLNGEDYEVEFSEK